MLSWSSEITNTPVDLRAITDTTVDPLTPGGFALVRYTDAVLSRSTNRIAVEAESVASELGPAGLVDAAAVIGNFEMMNRVADGTGMPVGRGSRARNADLIDSLGLDRYDHTEH